jgi:hypothetical protein
MVSKPDGDGGFEERVVNHFEEEVLKFEPTAVADAATAAAGAVAILRRFWKKMSNRGMLAERECSVQLVSSLSQLALLMR